jgi:hypothetical protein
VELTARYAWSGNQRCHEHEEDYAYDETKRDYRLDADDSIPIFGIVVDATWWEHTTRPLGAEWLGQYPDESDNDATKLEDLRRAENALRDVDDESREQGFEPCSAVAKGTATTVLTGLSRRFPRREWEVYPTQEREVAIEVRGPAARGLLILCDAQGGATCFVTIDGKNRRARYDDASRLPDSFVIDAMREL